MLGTMAPYLQVRNTSTDGFEVAVIYVAASKLILGTQSGHHPKDQLLHEESDSLHDYNTCPGVEKRTLGIHCFAHTHGINMVT